MNDNGKVRDQFAVGLIMRPTLADILHISGMFHMEHWRDGKLLHEEDFANIWTDVGKQLALNTILAGSAFTASVVMGLKGTGSAAATDTQASHSGWLEQGLANAPTYTAPRKTPTWNAASGSGTVAKATASNVTFAITSSGTVYGAFLNINGSSAIDNTTGTLFSAGDFASARAVVSGDTVNVGYTASLT